MPKKKFALVGCSSRALSSYGEPLVKEYADTAELVGVYDINYGRAAYVAKECGGVPVYKTYRELIDGAKSAGLSVIAMHTGGEARRGDLSDKFITPIFEKADYAIVVTAGDEDGLMAGICAGKGIPMDAIASISEVTTVLPAAFK